MSAWSNSNIIFRSKCYFFASTVTFTDDLLNFSRYYTKFYSYLATSAPGQATYGQGTGDIVLDELACTGTESSLFDCTHNGVNVHNCAHSEDAGVVCSG